MRTSFKLGIIAAILITALSAGFSPALAGDGTKDAEPAALPEIVVTATRSAQDVKDIPQAVTVVTSEDAERRQPLNPNEMLRESPGLWDVQLAVQGTPVIRGLNGNKVLYLWDGIPINNGALMSGPNGYFNQFPLGAIDRIEVIRGPGSLQYGSCAMGGVINIISKKMDEFSETPEWGGELYGSYGSVNKATTETADLWYVGRRWNFEGGITNQTVDDYTGADFGTIPNTGYDSLGGYFNLGFKPADNQVLHFSGIFNDREDVEFYASSKLNPDGVPRTIAPHETRGLGKLDYEFKDLGEWSKSLKLYLYYQGYDQQRIKATHTAKKLSDTIQSASQVVMGGGVQNITAFSKGSITCGADYRREEISSSQKLRTTTVSTGKTVVTIPYGNTPDGTYEVWDAFLMGQYNPFERLTVTAGGRYEGTRLKSEPEESDVLPNAGYDLEDITMDKTWDAYTFSLGAVFRLGGGFDLAANVANAFRAPTYSDTLSTGTPVFSSKTAKVASPDVGPEKSLTYEFGPRYHSGRWNVALTGYYTELRDIVTAANEGTVYIEGQGTFIAQRNANTDKGHIDGVEFEASYSPHPSWNIFFNCTYTEGRDDTTDDYLRFIPPLNGVLGVNYTAPSKRWWFEVTEVLVDKLRHHALKDELDAGFSTDPGYGSPSDTNPPLYPDYTLSGYAVTNVRAGWTAWKGEGNRSFELTLDVNNLFDKSYREAHAQQQLVAPGAGVVIGGRLKF